MSRSLTLSKIAEIDKKRQLTVYGWIRQHEKLYNQMIIEGIVIICVLFYGNYVDEWDPECIGTGTKLSNRTLIHEKIGTSSSFCKRVIESGVFKWRFKIDQCKNGGFILGIWRAKTNTASPPLTTWFTNGGFDAGYGFCLNIPFEDACLTNKEGDAWGSKYGIDPSNGSIIEMILDLNKLTLGFIIDDKDYGKAFDVEKDKYRAAVFFFREGTAITLLP